MMLFGIIVHPPDPGRLAMNRLSKMIGPAPSSVSLSLDLRDQLFVLVVVNLGRLTVVQSRVERDRNSHFLATRQGTRAGSRSQGFSWRADRCNWRAPCCKARYFRLLHGYRLATSCLVPSVPSSWQGVAEQVLVDDLNFSLRLEAPTSDPGI